MHRKFQPKKAALQIPLAALAALAGIPAVPQAHALTAAASPTETSEVRSALEEARIGNLAPLESLLNSNAVGPSQRLLLEAQRSAALLREVQATEALRRYFARGDDNCERRSRAHTIAAETAFFSGRYREAAWHAAEFLTSTTGGADHEIDGMRRLKQIAELLAGAPGQQIETSGAGTSAVIARDRVGLLRAMIRVNAAEEQAVIDTGANLSVASASAARRMGLRMIEGDTAVGNSLGNEVGVRLGIADRVEIAGAVLRNVVFLVMDDEALTFPVPGGYRIDAILGLPALRALGRLRFGPGETLRIEPESAAVDGPANLRLIGSSPYVVVSIAGEEHPLFFDSGANSTSVSQRFTAEHPELRISDAGETRRAGAGGVERVRNQTAEGVAVRIGSAEAVLPTLNVEAQPAPGDEHRYGVAGADLLRHFDSVIIDFDNMRFEAEKRQ